jgi:hypothetical protein
MIGTVKFTNLDATDHFCVSQGIECLKNAYRGEWVLVQAYNKHHEYDWLRNLHTAQQHRLNLRSPFIPPLDHLANNSGIITFKDSKVMISTVTIYWKYHWRLYYMVQISGQSSVFMGYPLFLGGRRMKCFKGQIFWCLHQ